MKKVLAWVLLLATILSLFAGCKKNEEAPVETTVPTSGVTAAQAIEYLKAVYPTSREVIKTAVDYERMAVVRINNIPLNVVWTVDVAEDLVKIVPNDDGTVTVDVKEQSETEVNYTLTATVTDDAGGTASYSWKYMLPAFVFVDMAAVVEEAYKLKDGQKMDYAVTLTGKISRVKEVYNPDFKNITVVIEVEGAEDKPITCYRMKGEGADKLKVGDTITVTGVITNYKGTIEFEAGCTLDAYIEGEGVKAPEDMGQIVKEAYALADGKALPYEAILTGKITKINTPYDKGYKNVSVTMVVKGYEKYPILCYRIKGEGADNLFIGDTITVRGYITNYKGTIEYEAGSLLEKVEKTGTEIKAPSDVKQILKDAYALKENDSLPYEATLTGIITKVNTPYDAGYQNVTVTIVVDGINEYPIKCYRLKGSGANKIGKGDTITVTGWITNYKGTIEFAAGCTLDKWKDTGSDVEKDEIFIPTLVPEMVTNPVPGTAYKFYVEQKILKKTLYFTGKMDGYYFETTEDPEQAADVFVEQVSGGYRVYTMNSGRKNYLEIVKSGDYTNVKLTTSPSKTLKWNDTIKSVTCDVGGEAFYFGSYKQFETFSASNISYVTGDKADAFDVTNFVGHFATLKESADAQKTPAELVFNALQAEYLDETKVYSTAENFKLQNVFDVKGNKVNVTWTVDNKAVTIVDNKDGTVTVKVVRAKEDTLYKLTATIVDGDKTYTATANYKVPAKAVSGAAAIVDLAYSMQPGEALPDTYTLTGVMIGTDTPYSAQYKNISVVIVVEGKEDKPILCYRMKGDGADKIGKGDTITVTGILKNYNGIIEFDTGCTLDSWKNTGTDAPATTPDIELKPGGGTGEVEKPDAPTTNLVPEVVETPAANTAYKFVLNQKGLGQYLYITGEMDGYYYGTTADPAAAVDVYLETVSGGYRVYFLKNGVKTYLEMAKSGTHNNVIFTTAPTKTLKWNAEIKSVTCDIEGEDFYFGTYNTYKTFSASQVSRITGENASAMDSTNFVARFATLVEGEEKPTEPTTPTEPEPTEPTEPSIVPEIVTTPAAGTAYKFMVNQKIVGKVLYLTGEMNGYYFATTENAEEAADVYLEAVSGGYRVYFLKDGVKNYLEVVQNGTYTNVVFTTSPTKVLKWNDEIKSVTCDVDGTDYYFGSYKTFVTFSASKISYVTGENASTFDESNFVGHFATLVEGETPTVPTEPSTEPTEPSTEPTEPSTEPTEPSTEPTEPADAEYITEPVTGKAYKFMLTQKNLDKKLYITGAMDGYYYGTTEDAAEAVDVYFEAVEGGYRVYFLKDGTKTYLEMTKSGTHNNVVFVTAPTKVLKWNAEIASVTCDIEGEDFYFGTYNTYKTFSASTVSRVTGENASAFDTTNFVGHFYEIGGETPTEPTEPSTEPTEPSTEPTEPSTEPTEPSAPSVSDVYTTAPAVGTAYKMRVNQKLAGKTLFLTGEMNGYYYATTEDVNEAIDVYFEAADGGYRVYFLVDGVKNYLEIVVNGTYTNVVFTTTPTAVLKWNEEIASVTCEANGTDYYFGSYKTFVTFSASKISYVTGENASTFDESNFVAHFYEVSGGETPTEPTEPSTEPTEPSTEPTEPEGEVYDVVAGQNLDIALEAAENVDTVTFKYSLTEGTMNLALVDTNGSYYGYFAFDKYGNVDKYDGVSVEKLDDTTFAVTLEIAALTKLSGTPEGNLSKIYVRGAWTDGTGFIYAVAFTASKPEATEPSEPEATEPSETEPSAPAENGYIKVTALDQLETGKYVLIVNTGYAPGAVDGTWLSAAQPVVSGDKVTDTKGAVWTLTVSANGVSLMDANGVYVAPKGGNNNGIKTGTEYVWAVTFTNGTFRFAGTGSDTVLLASNADAQYGNKFRGYKTTTVSGNANTYPADFTLYKLVGEETAPEASEPTTEPTTAPTEPTVGVQIVTDPVPGVAYKFMLTQKNLGKDLYLTGSMDGYYYGTTEEAGSAADVYVEAVEGGYRAYVLKSGEKNYMEIVLNGTYKNVVFTTAPTKVLKWNAGINSFTCDVDGVDYYFGTYNTYKTFSASDISRVTGEGAATMDVTNFVGHLVNLGNGNSTEPTEPSEPGATEPTTTDVTYKYGSSDGYANVILNWGKRGAKATFMSPNGKKFYSDNNLTYADLAALSGSSNLSNVSTSALYKKLQEVMTNAQTKETSYGDVRYLFAFTDCQESNSSTITCFYSGAAMNSVWDQGATYNREHCWPKSLTASGTATNSTKGINGDVMTLRPVTSSLNSSRGNKGYGTSVDFFNPNSAANGAYDLRGDVARIVLYTYVRWGNTQYMWGASGVMESKEILLNWMAADPVDTWELGRNDSVESITGTRNVFVDYPELAFILFGESVPAMTTPSGNAA